MDVYEVDCISNYLNKKYKKITNYEDKKAKIKCQIEKNREKVDEITYTIDEIINDRIIKHFSPLFYKYINEEKIKNIYCGIDSYQRYDHLYDFYLITLYIKYYDYYDYRIEIYDEYIKVEGSNLDITFIRYLNHKTTGCIDMDKIESERKHFLNGRKYQSSFDCSCGCYSEYKLRDPHGSPLHPNNIKIHDFDLYNKLETIINSLKGMYEKYAQIRYNMFNFPILKYEKITLLILCANKYKDGILSSIPRDVFLIIAKKVFKGRFEKKK